MHYICHCHAYMQLLQQLFFYFTIRYMVCIFKNVSIGSDMLRHTNYYSQYEFIIDFENEFHAIFIVWKINFVLKCAFLIYGLLHYTKKP
jgi:hypothetical protein